MKVPQGGGKGSLLLVISVHSNLVVSREAIKEGHNPSSRYFLQQVFHLGQWIVVFFGTLVQVSKIHTQPDFSIFLSYHYYICNPLGIPEGDYDLGFEELVICFSITGDKRGLMGLNFYLKGMVSFSKGILC